MNNKSKISKLDLTKEKNYFKKIIPNQSFNNCYETDLMGQGLIHGGHSACEYNEVCVQQHAIVVHLKPETNSLRRMGDRLEVENVNVGDVAIIPAKRQSLAKNRSRSCRSCSFDCRTQYYLRHCF